MTRILLCLALVAVGVSHADDERSLVERRQLAKVADQWLKLAKWCVPKRLGSEARAAVERARAASPSQKVTQLEERARGCPDEASDSSRAAYAKRRERTGAKVASLYDGLARALRADAPQRADGYAWSALEAEPNEARWAEIASILRAAVAAKADARVEALLARARDLGPPESLAPTLTAAADSLAQRRMVLRKASAHPLRYYLSLPEGYDREAEREWPVLVCVSGAGSDFKGFGEGYRKRRGDLPLLIVSPCTFANTNAIQGKLRERYGELYSPEELEQGIGERMRFDLAGLLAVLDDLRTTYRAQPRVYVTGFSGGGRLTYRMLFRHPERVAAAAPACGNFNPADAEGGEQAKASERNLPIHLLTGAEDPHRVWTHGKEGSPGIEQQTDWAVEALTQLGYPKFKRTLVPGLGHSAAQERVLAFFSPYVRGEKQRADPWE